MLFSIESVCACAGILLIIAFCRYLYLRLFSRHSIPGSIPWVSQANDPWSRAKTTLQSFFHTRDLVQDGYDKYSRNNIPFVLPNITTGPEVILPMSQLEWLLQQPDDTLSQNEVNRAFLQADHTMLHPRVVSDHIHEDVIRKELTKLLGDHVDDMQEEIDFAFRKEWGDSTEEWREVIAYESMLNVIARVSNRVLVGLPLCRDEEYLDNTKNFARLVVVQAILISLIPKFLKGIFAPLINILDYRRYLATTKHTLPLIKQRLSSSSPDEKAKNDYITWSLSHSLTSRDPSQLSPSLISKRLAVLQFATIQSSTITLTNALLDLASYPSLPSLFSYLQTSILSTSSGGKMTKAELAKIVGLDSVLRESMRLHGFVSRGVMKKVVAREGVRLPSGKILPKGVNVGVHQRVHLDQDIYGLDAGDFRPLRFIDEGKGEGVRLERCSGDWLGFSAGRHACPGRFFAAQQMKLVLAYIAMNYDIERIQTRPENQWLVGSQGPPLDFKIRIRRRVGTV